MEILFIGITDHMSDRGYDHIFKFTRFEMLAHYGPTIPDNTCIWVSWDGRDYMDCGTDLYNRLNSQHRLEERGLCPTKSLFLPDPLIWDASHDLLMILGEADDLHRRIGVIATTLEDLEDMVSDLLIYFFITLYFR